MKKKYVMICGSLLIFLISFNLCFFLLPNPLFDATFTVQDPIDPLATENTVNLYRNLRIFTENKTLFGHQDTTLYGLNGNNFTLWNGENNRSDVKTLTGSFPAVYGFDIGGIEEENGTASPALNRIVSDIQDAFLRKGIITLSWHCKNFITGNPFNDTSEAVIPSILPEGSHHQNFVSALDHIASLFGNIEIDGESIPILFRPWHEHNGNWFWWGKTLSTSQNFIDLFQFTVSYLMNEKQVHNFLYVYSPNLPLIGGFTNASYFNRYPGDDYVDIFGFDGYDHSYYWDSLWKGNLQQALRKVVELANARGKIPALTEVGVGNGLSMNKNSHWFTEILLDALKQDRLTRQIAYVLTWRNANFAHYWIPYPGGINEADFLKMYADPFMVFEKDLPDLYHLNS